MTLTDGLYVFDEEPVCNYPETVTLTNLPSFVTHNEASSDFTIPQTGDLSLLGEYPVTIRSEICVPDDHTQNTCTTMFKEYDFVVVMQPCIVDTYTADQAVGDLSYNIGADSLLNVGEYVFGEDPSCGYPETVTITGLPDFITHNEGTSDFDIPKTTNLDLIGEYTVTIRSEIDVPDDPTSGSTSTMFAEYSFTIFIEPCIVNTYTATLEVADISYNIGAPELANVGPYVFDEDPVCNYPETVTLTNLPVFVTHNAPASDDFTVPYNDDLDLIGSYVVTIRSEISIPDDYTKTTFTTMSAEHDFIVFVEPCLVSTYEATKQIIAIVYNVNQETLTDGHYIFDEDPVCNYPETVTVTNLPTWATHNEPTSDFTIP